MKILYIKKNDYSNIRVISMKKKYSWGWKDGDHKCVAIKMWGYNIIHPLPPPVTIYMYLYIHICISYMWYHFNSACKIYVRHIILRRKNHLFVHKHCSWSRMSKWMVQEELPKSIHILQKSIHRYFFFLSLFFTVLLFIISLILQIITIYILVEIFLSLTQKTIEIFNRMEGVFWKPLTNPSSLWWEIFCVQMDDQEK